MDLNTPEGRLAAAEQLGPDGYNKAMAAHQKANTVETVNGYGLRWVSSRFGRLCMVDGTDKAFQRIEQARSYANSLPRNRDLPRGSYVFANLTLEEGDAIFAALRLLAHSLKYGPTAIAPDDGDLGDVLTNSGKHGGLTADEVHDLCDALLAGEHDPR